MSVCLSIFPSPVIMCSVILYLLIFVVILASSLDKHLLFWHPVTDRYIVFLLQNLYYATLHDWLNKLIDKLIAI